MSGEGIRVEVEIPYQRLAAAPPAYSGPVVLGYGFRIFFLLGGVSAIALMLAWISVYAFGLTFANHFDLVQWHAHEMLFGFVAAIIAGFLLTAPGNWTGRPMPKGGKLGGLVVLWLAGRMVSFFPSVLPAWLITLVDIAFLPALGWVVYAALRGAARQKHNLVFPFLMLVMTAANGMAHLGIRNRLGQAVGTEMMLYLVLLLISVMGGRVIPGFTQGQFPQGTSRVRGWVDKFAIGSLMAVSITDLSGAPGMVVAGFCLVAALAHALRLWDWHTRETWRVPLLWVLHIGYGWMIIGFVLKAAALLGVFPPLLFRHAFTAGTIGGIIYGMICRITLGHTGRPMRLPRFIVTGMVLINLAVLLRVVFVWFFPSYYLLWLKLSAATWVLAFGIFLFQYGPMLVRPRADGRPG
jgi:uncharacterized protein involved in response to NO